MPKRIQRRRTKGWRMPQNTVCVTRPTQWGNPFREGPTLTKEEAVEAYRALILRDYKTLRFLWPWTAVAWISVREGKDLNEWVRQLRGKDLACFCPLDKPCHADVLLELANR